MLIDFIQISSMLVSFFIIICTGPLLVSIAFLVVLPMNIFVSIHYVNIVFLLEEKKIEMKKIYIY